MSLSRWLLGLCVLVVATSPAAAQDPFRFVPSQAEIVVTVDRTADLVNAIETNELFKDAQKLAGVREAYETTNIQQLYALIGFFEKQLGLKRNEIIEQVSARVIFAARVTDKKGAMAVIQAKDAKTLRRFLDVAFDILQQELDRQESKDKVVRKKQGDFEIGQIGSKLSFAISDATLVVATDEKVLKAALDASVGKGEQKSILSVANFIDARKAAPPKALGWAWIHLDEIRKFQNFKDGLNAASLDPLQVLLFGGLTDLLKRSPYLSASLLRESETLHRVSIQMPRGREGMAALAHMILPTPGKGVLSPLMPPRVLSTTSYHLDLGQYWDKRVDILGEKNAKGLEEGSQNLAKVLGGIKLEKLFHAAGPHHRLVFAQQKESPYKVKPGAPFPAVALVVDMRDPSFAKDMNSILRSAALLATFSVGLALKEETYKDCELVSYHFNEKKKVDFDPTNIRFNFTPTYVTCGDQFIMSGTAELARDLIDVLKSERKGQPGTASMRSEAFASGLVNLARTNQDLLMTQLILAQALPPNTAKKEVEAIFNYLDRLGSVRLEMNYGANDFRYDIIWQAKKK
ncbi:MAG TPA: hypothetical protein VFE62_05830 [Gemmataceae bacterium]|nr:hypothetical protein [Gemmataceae bacterium]